MGEVVSFPAHLAQGFQPVKANYTCREIRDLFGLSERALRRWVQQGIVRAVEEQTLAFDFAALPLFRRARELRAEGYSLQRIETELRGQMNLFEEASSDCTLIQFPRSTFLRALDAQERQEECARALFLEAVDEGEYVADSYCNLGLIEFEASRVAPAVDYLTLALRHDPRHFEAQYNLANVYLDARQYRLAQLHYEIAQEIEPTYPNLSYNLGVAYGLQGDLDRSYRCFTRYSELSPDAAQSVSSLLAQLKNALAAARQNETAAVQNEDAVHR
ncbi:MAG: MerR family transcriptional regulator [Acidobacteriota bacterium]